jgi:hypothetical protein
MAAKVKSVAILDNVGDVINLRDSSGMKPAAKFSTIVLGLNV